MGIEWFRDLIICIFGVMAIGVLIFIVFLSYFLYQKSKALMDVMHAVYLRANSILDAIETTSETMRSVTSDIKKVVVNPVTQIIATIQGISQAINVINKVFRKKEEEKENE